MLSFICNSVYSHINIYSHYVTSHYILVSYDNNNAERHKANECNISASCIRHLTITRYVQSQPLYGWFFFFDDQRTNASYCVHRQFTPFLICTQFKKVSQRKQCSGNVCNILSYLVYKQDTVG